MSSVVPASALLLPTVTATTDDVLTQVTTALGVPRAVLPSKEQIDHSWANLPRLLGMIPPELRDERMIRLCVAVSVGLFDSAINYAWNSTVVELRMKIVRFGLPIVAQLTSKAIDEKKLSELMDHELLKLCLELNLITEEGYFKLDQCRDIRNNFSAAHPAVGALDEDEVVNFISRCAREALSSINVPAGVNFKALVTAVRAGDFSVDQSDYWSQSIKGTHSAQRELIATALHGMYCDDTLGQTGRNNCALLFPAAIDVDGVPSKVIDHHQEYVGKGDAQKAAASRDFFTRFGLLDLLSEPERHAIISTACDRLMAAHQGTNNFYNEPPFAERLQEIVSAASLPDSVRMKYVHTVVACAIGNQYGVSWTAEGFYQQMIRNFTPKAMEAMFDLPGSKSIVGSRIASYARCRLRFAEIAGLLQEVSIPTKLKKAYDSWISEIPKV